MLKMAHNCDKNQICFCVKICYNLNRLNWRRNMDFTFIEKLECDGICYKLLRANFYRNYYVIIAQDKTEFACGSIRANLKEARALLLEIAKSNTDICCLMDILSDFTKQKA